MPPAIAGKTYRDEATRRAVDVLRATLHWVDSFAAICRITPSQAEERVIRACLRRPERCPRCKADEPWAFADGRRRCASCRHTFRLLTGRWLARLRVSEREWCILIKCFERGLNGRETIAMSGLSGPTVYKGLRTLRACLGGPWQGSSGTGAFDAILDAVARYVPEESPREGDEP